jgi:hypothetical protein
MPLGDLEDEAMAKVLIVAQDQVLDRKLEARTPYWSVASKYRSLQAVSRQAFKPKVFIQIA